jgi:hypothetical protein
LYVVAKTVQLSNDGHVALEEELGDLRTHQGAIRIEIAVTAARVGYVHEGLPRRVHGRAQERLPAGYDRYQASAEFDGFGHDVGEFDIAQPTGILSRRFGVAIRALQIAVPRYL